MIGIIFLIFILFFLSQGVYNILEKNHRFFDKKKMNLLFFYHLFFFFFYWWYSSNNPSDSKHYFDVISTHSGSWFELFGTDTKFIYFLGYPFFQLGFSYEMLMLLFSWFGFLGFVFAYLFFRENIPIKIKVFKYFDFLTLLLFLPNMHFWTVALSKGAPIFLGLMMFVYAIAKPKKRMYLLGLASIIIFYIRPHVFMFVAVGAVLGYMSGREKIPTSQKFLIYFTLIGTLVLVQDQILAVVNLQNSENLVEGFQEFAEGRAEDLSVANSGVNMASYSLPYKFFTFWFRPLFYDARNLLGLITSAENFLYLLLFFRLFKKDFLKFLRKSPALVKMSLVIFLSTSFAMTFVMSNLGIIMRQKSMVMYFLFFIIYYYLAQKKYIRLKKLKRLRELQEKQKQEVATA